MILVDNNFYHLQYSDSFSGDVFSISDDEPLAFIILERK